MQEIAVVTWKPLTLSFSFHPFQGSQEQLTIMERRSLRTCFKGRYFGERVIKKKVMLVGLEFAHAKYMCICFPQCTKDSCYKPPSY